mmetsp:Transcript_83643/g.249594  ORF Transcript_83643/g.249594 Transcript_83643/m.249594 type:complete len:220 (+) Transcript_83643:434-1093(+)
MHKVREQVVAARGEVAGVAEEGGPLGRGHPRQERVEVGQPQGRPPALRSRHSCGAQALVHELALRGQRHGRHVPLAALRHRDSDALRASRTDHAVERPELLKEGLRRHARADVVGAREDDDVGGRARLPLRKLTLKPLSHVHGELASPAGDRHHTGSTTHQLRQALPVGVAGSIAHCSQCERVAEKQHRLLPRGASFVQLRAATTRVPELKCHGLLLAR